MDNNSTTAVPPPSATVPQAGSPDWLKDVPQGQAFDPDAFAAERLGQPKQHYHTATEPQPDPPPPGAEDAPGSVQMRSATNRRTAGFIISVLNNIQSNVFAVVAGNEDPSVFRIKQNEQDDLVSYLEEGVGTANITIPWWLPFTAMLGMVLFMNYRKAADLKKQRVAEEKAAKLKAEEEARAKGQGQGQGQEQRQAQPPMPRRMTRPVAKKAAPKAPAPPAAK